MPQNKPMKIQWITVNGRQVPLVLPQTYSYADDDWKITSDQDPLPVVEYGTTEGGVIVPKRLSDEGHELTQLTGSIVEKRTTHMSRRILRSDFSRKLVIPDPHIKGAIFYLVIHGVTGSFSTGQGISLRLLQTTQDTTSVWSLRLSEDRTDPVSIGSGYVILVVNEKDNYEDLKPNRLLASKNLKKPINIAKTTYLTADVSGDFGVDEGFDCEIQVEWLY